MPILIGAKGATISGVNYPPYAYIDWLSPAQEAVAVQGGDAVLTPARGLTPGETDGVRALVLGAGIGLVTPDNSSATMAVAVANARLINAASVSGATVTVAAGLGDVYVGAVSIASNSNFAVGPGTSLKRVAGYSYNVMRNLQAPNGCYVNGTALAGGSFTMPEPGHTRQVGDVVWVEGFLGNTSLNGPKTVVTSTPGVSWTFAATGSNPTNAVTQLAFVSDYAPLPGANVTRASNVVTVLEAGHLRGIGNHVYVTGLGGTNTFNGAQEITSIVPGVSWTYANTGANETATGTGCLLGDRNIDVLFEIDGNSENVSATQWGAHGTVWINCSVTTVRVRKARNVRYGRTVAGFNVSDFRVPQFHSDRNLGVGIQFDSFCTRVIVAKPTGLDYCDDVLAWGTTSNTGAFGDTASPTGPGSMGSLTVDALEGNSNTGIFKMYATAGTHSGKVQIGDSTAGVNGGTITSLTIGDLDNVPPLGVSQIGLGGSGAFSNMGHLKFGRVIDNAVSAATTGYVLGMDGDPFDTLTIDQYITRLARTNASFCVGSLLKGAGNTLRINNLETVGDANLSLFYLQNVVIDTVLIGNWVHNGTSQSCTLWNESGTGYAKNIFFRVSEVCESILRARFTAVVLRALLTTFMLKTYPATPSPAASHRTLRARTTSC